MPFQGRETPVQVVEVAGAAPDVGALPRDEYAQFLGDSFTVTSRTEGRQLARPIERKIERAEADQEPEPLNVRRGVLPIAVSSPLGGAQETLGFVESNGLRGRARLASQLADLHGETVDLSVAGMSRPHVC